MYFVQAHFHFFSYQGLRHHHFVRECLTAIAFASSRVRGVLALPRSRWLF